MERARTTWTDERLDDLARKVDDGFNRVDADIRTLSTRVDVRFDRVDARFDRLDARIDTLQRLMVQVGGGMTVAILATLVTVVATRA